jgi:hypothetical protein
MTDPIYNHNPKDKFPSKIKKTTLENGEVKYEIEWGIGPIPQEEMEAFRREVQQRLAEKFQIKLEKTFGISPIKQAIDDIKRMSKQAQEGIWKKRTVNVCICCKHWEVVKNETRLTGVCLKRNKEETGYEFICDEWEEINVE